MVILVAGQSHSGKTLTAQKLIEHFGFQCFSLDHLKMGHIRAGLTELTPDDDGLLTDYLWPIVREIIKTAIENEQNLIIEGCYIPSSFENDFEKYYSDKIKAYFLVLDRQYIINNYDTIMSNANAAEKRLYDCTTKEELLDASDKLISDCKKADISYTVIDGNNTIFNVIDGITNEIGCICENNKA